MPLFEVDAAVVEPVFHKLYSYIFDMEDGGYSVPEMDRPVPNAIFVVNFDKVWSHSCPLVTLSFYLQSK